MNRASRRRGFVEGKLFFRPVLRALRFTLAAISLLLVAALSSCAVIPLPSPAGTRIPASAGEKEKAGVQAAKTPAARTMIPDLEQKYFISRLPGDELAVCAALYKGIAGFMPSISFDAPVPEATLKDMMWLLSYDCPELFQINGEYSYYVQENAPGKAVSIRPTYILTKDEYEAANAKVEQALDGIKAAVASKDEYAAEKWIYDWIIAHCSYEENGTFDGTAYGALVLGHARCEGYSKALSLALRAAGISDLILTGEAWTDDASGPRAAQKHAWNVVQLGGKWYQADVTWDDSDGKLPEGVCYAYFNLTDSDIYKSRTLDSFYSGMTLPGCVSLENNYYTMTGKFVQEGENVKQAFTAALDDAYKAGSNALSLRLSSDAQMKEVTDSLEKWMSAWYRSQRFSSGSYNWTQFSVSDVVCIIDIAHKK